MLRGRGSSNRGARGVATSSRGSSTSRGRGRGASSSSSKLSHVTKPVATSSSEWLKSRGHHRPRAPTGRGYTPFTYLRRTSRLKHTDTALKTDPPNTFEKERLENAAKREQKSHENGAVNGRGGRGTSRGRFTNKSVRFALTDSQESNQSADSGVSSSTNSPFGANVNAGQPSQASFKPAAQTVNPFGAPSGNTSTKSATLNPFGASTQVSTKSPSPFGAPSSPSGTQPSSVFGAPSGLAPNRSNSSPFGNNVASTLQKQTVFGDLTSSGRPINLQSVSPFPISSQSKPPGSTFSTFGSGSSTRQRGANPLVGNEANSTKSKLAIEIDNLLRKNDITAPPWPTPSPGDPAQKGAVENFWQSTKAYRAKVRTCLIRNGYLDDPEKPKKLSEAIDFKGTCESMCPEFEKITRIVEHDVQAAEKELAPDGQNYWPSPQKMVKALARSAAGQDAPLPEDVRSPAALRRTLDYLIDEVLGVNDLATAHGFLWDRTRAIRRDFVFQQSSMTTDELRDQIYCLEVITRFHVTALHEMSREGIVAEDFSEQQEVEQLGKALLSLIHAYEDSTAHGIHSENEAEFRAYYVLFNSHNTGILEAVQDWGYKFWGESDEIRTAVNLVEALQNTWDTHGPLRPHLATDIAQNAYHRFFSIIKDIKVSYTMACFAEIHFNKIRKAALKTIMAGYRKQRDHTTDWSLQKLNAYLHFDHEEDIIAFGEAYGLHFESSDDQDYLSFENEKHNPMNDPHPQLRQAHSYNLVERKRGKHPLAEVIHRTVFEDPTAVEDAGSMFVPASPTQVLRDQATRSRSTGAELISKPLAGPTNNVANVAAPDITPSTQGEAFYTSSTNSQVRNFPPPFPSEKQNSGHTGNENSSASPAIFPQKTVDSDKKETPNNAETTSIFDRKSSLPESGVFSFLGQLKPALDNSSWATPAFSLPTPSPSSTKPPEKNLSTVSTPQFQLPGTIDTSPGRTEAPKSILKSATNRFPSFNFASPEQTVHTPGKDQSDQKAPGSARNVMTPPKLGGSNNNGSALPSLPPVMAPEPAESKMPAFASWVALGKGGLIYSFTEMKVEEILMRTVTTYLADEEKRRVEEEDRLSRRQAANFRYKFLATKYCHKWRVLAHRLWMKRKGRRAREARRQMAEESFRTSRVAKKDIVEDFKSSTNTAKRRSVDQMLVATDVLNGVHNPEEEMRRITKPSSNTSTGLEGVSPRKPKRTSQLINGKSSTSSNNSQDHLGDALRRSLLSDSAYLQGGSRIHLMSNYSPKATSGRQPNGVKTDYFRLKARGIMTLPNGTPLANTAAVHLNVRKQSLEDLRQPRTPKQSARKPLASSVPAKPVTKESVLPKTSAEIDEEFETLKARARAIMAKDKEERTPSKKRLLDDDDEDLFAKAKRIREQMDEGAAWFREEIQKSFSRSVS
jgi:hypothetical protein